MYKKIAILLLILAGWGCDGNPQDFTIYKKGEVTPVVVVTEPALHSLAEDLCDLFEQVAGIRPKIVEQAGKDEVAISVGLFSKKDKSDNAIFSLSHKEKAIEIKGINKEALYYANRYLFAEFAGFSNFNLQASAKKTNEIKVPIDLAIRFSPSFEYREPYFPDNFNKEYRRHNMTHTLEEEWGLWGHNIGKAVPYNKKMFAVIDGEVNEEQYCFTSPELKDALAAYIKSNPAGTGAGRYMIMPNDNMLVCQCDRCIEAGNTKNNASPAVFSMLNKLAKQLPDRQFFSTAYITTQKAPNFKLEKNTGVMLSTMEFPKAVVLAESDKKNMVEGAIAEWKKVTDKIYLWDYAVNFDNYFEFYPTVSIAQKNLQFYKSRGVTGVFMHGSEDRYSVFAGVKCYLYAKLLQDADANIKRHASNYFTALFPQSGSMLFDYFIKADQLAAESKITHDIYGGVTQARKKYLDASGFNAFYNKLTRQADSIQGEEKENLQPLLLAFTFQKLELMRTSGLKDGGYAIMQNNKMEIKPETLGLLETLKQLKAATGIDVYNESGATLTAYIENWQQLLDKGYHNLLYNKKLQVLFKADEDYANSRMLIDGATGFTDYYNNWMLFTQDVLKVKAEAADVAGATSVVMNFLHDPRHKIYLPQRVEVLINNREYQTTLPVVEGKKPAIVTVSIPIELKSDDKAITIGVIKQEQYENRSAATDEIYFKK
ncbi:DUF4838 domain-containing protein [Flavobacterium sp.]|uniref:DUF4838 domain-containing protein n=1 Tax=Flavobacterium sp. TaxID=239 RepID=UPI00260720B2|nr:DUF4838 domain-containing protein [Flavobacterium sp.]